MSHDDSDGIEDIEEPPRPAKRRKTAKVSEPKAKPAATKGRPPRPIKSDKSAERVIDSEDDDPPPRPKEPARAKKAAKATKSRKKKSPTPPSPSSGSDDAFEAPVKRGLIPKAIKAVDSDSDDRPKAKKPKHRVHESAIGDVFHDRFCPPSQIPPESSDPSAVRGPIWKLPPNPPPRVKAAAPPPPPKKATAPSQKPALPPPAPRPVTAPSFVQALPQPAKASMSMPPPPARPPKQSPAGISATRQDSQTLVRSGDAKAAKKKSRDDTALPAPQDRPWSAPFVIDSSDDDFDDPELEVHLADAAVVKQPAPAQASSEIIPLSGSSTTGVGRLPVPTFTNARSLQPIHRHSTKSPPPRSLSLPSAINSTRPNASSTKQAEDELADLPEDAFLSEDEELAITRVDTRPLPAISMAGGLSTGFKQTTLHGSFSAPADAGPALAKKATWPLANKDEKPTHHGLDLQNTSTWVYPINLGTIRDYQYSIVQTGLYHNLLCALPTGLGKTFIAATIMFNWYRWTKDAQIVFVAPTKPLVAQQVEACFHTVGIPRSQTAMLTGTISPALRAEAWSTKRVFFMTPQTMGNDLRSGICDPKRVVLMVIDEAHRATGNYSYVDIIRFIRRFNTSFRTLALTATPGAKIETVQEVIDNLDISRVEIRTEQSIDIRQYVFQREVETHLFDYSDEQQMIMELFSKAIQPVLDKLNGQNAYWLKDPMKLTAFGLTQAQRQWQASEAGRSASHPVKGMVSSIFRVLASLAHGISMLKFHGIGPFFRRIVAFKKEIDEGGTKMKSATQIRSSEHFNKMNNYIQSWINNPDFIGHPKLEFLRSVILNHFMDAGETGQKGAAPSGTRVMIFAQFRDSAEQIARVLKRNEPMLRPHVFVGQAASENSAGMDQKTQLDVIEKFKAGTYNTLVATSIGEEGLDIGEVDLIICYDANASPIRMLQRMGRTGRKRRGKIVLLLMRDKEERDFATAKDNYEKMQGMIASGKHFNYHEDRSPRILPRDVRPAVEKRVVEIPIENSQADLPEPRKGPARKPKKPAKKFHMPDGVITGFVKASRVRGDGSEAEIDSDEPAVPKKVAKKPISKPRSSIQGPAPEPEPMPLPFLEDVLLNKVQERELERKYQYVTANDNSTVVQAPMPEKNLAAFRNPGPTKLVGRGRYTQSIVATLDRIRNVDGFSLETWRQSLHESDLEEDPGVRLAPTPQELELASDSDVPVRVPTSKPKTAARKGRQAKPKPAKAKPATKASKPAPKRNARQRRNSSDMEGDASPTPEPTPREYALPSQAESLGEIDTSGDEEPQNTQAYLLDSELADFIARSDEIEFASSSAPGISLLDGGSTPARPARRGIVSRKPADEDSDEDELPDVSTVRGFDAGRNEGLSSLKGRRRAQDGSRRKRVVMSDDSDE